MPNDAAFKLTSMADQALERAVLVTVRYFDLFDLPITATQVWRCLVKDKTQGSVSYSLSTIVQTLQASDQLRGKIETKWGYYFLTGKENLVRERLNRHVLAQDKWKIVRRFLPLLASVPFVRALAGSGSLALDNTKGSSDLDLFIIVKSGRIWTARLLLLVVAQLTGRRRTYWDAQAPGKMCLNHYVADNHLALADEVKNVYTAVQYTLHVPLYGRAELNRFRTVNKKWIETYVSAPAWPDLPHQYEYVLPAFVQRLKQFFENWLLEPVGNSLEYFSEKLQRATIARHQGLQPVGRVVMNQDELAFHPYTKVPAILQQFLSSK